MRAVRRARVALPIGFFFWAGCGIAPSDSPDQSGHPAPAFTDVTEAGGLMDFRHTTGAFGALWFPEITGSGGGSVDYDSDGWIDIVLVGGGTWREYGHAPVPRVRLYRNDRDGTFSDVTKEAGLATIYAYAQGVVAADYDNDGDADLYITAVGHNLLLSNQGGKFSDVADEAGVRGRPAWSTAAAFLDADRDGWLDLYVGNYVKWSPETDQPCLLPDGSKSYCTPEGYVGEGPFFFRNNGNGTFTDLGLSSGFALDPRGRARAGMGIDAGVVDTTDRETIFVGNFSREMMSVFRYGDGLQFEERSTLSGIGKTSILAVTFGLLAFGATLDGDLDVLAVNGHVQIGLEDEDGYITFRQRAQLYINDGTGYFREASYEGTVFDQRLPGRGVATGDIDRDGDPGILATENGGRAHLWRNETRTMGYQTPGFLRLLIEGRSCNRDALGGRVIASSGGRRQQRYVRSGGSYLSQSQSDVFLGLGASRLVDSLHILWPSGATEVFHNVPANPELWLVEASEALRPIDAVQEGTGPAV